MISDEDKECVGLGNPGNQENTTECAFFPCMKALGWEGDWVCLFITIFSDYRTDSDTKEKIRLYYCGYDETFSNICEFEDFVKLLFIFKDNLIVLKPRPGHNI